MKEDLKNQYLHGLKAWIIWYNIWIIFYLIKLWNLGTNFVESLAHQYSKHANLRDQEIISNFGTVKLPVDLGDIFKGQRAVDKRYAQRTSSAVWTTPPSKYLNMSMNRTKTESIIEPGN